MMSNYIAAIARSDSTSSSSTNFSIDSDAVDSKLFELWRAMTKSNQLPTGYTLFVLDLPVAQSLSAVVSGADYAYRRGWSKAELVALSEDPDVQSIVEDMRAKDDELDDYEDLFETDVIPADMPRELNAEESRSRRRRKSVGQSAGTQKEQELRVQQWCDATSAEIKELGMAARGAKDAAVYLLRQKSHFARRRQLALLHALEQHAGSREIRYAEYHARSHSLDASNVRRTETCVTHSWLSQFGRYGWYDVRSSSSSSSSSGSGGFVGTFRGGSVVRGGGTAKRSAMKDDDDWTFVRHLTPVVSSFMRQVVTPPTRARRRVAKDVRRVESIIEIRNTKTFPRLLLLPSYSSFNFFNSLLL